MTERDLRHSLAMELLLRFRQFQLSEFRIRKWDAERFTSACKFLGSGWTNAAQVCTDSIGHNDVVPELLKLEFADEERFLQALRLAL